VFYSLAPASIYAVLGAGFVILFRGTRVVNFTQGQLALIGALIFVTTYTRMSGNLLVAVTVALVAAIITGVLFHTVIMAPLTGQGFLIMALFTLIFGTAILDAVIAIVWGVNSYYLRLPLGRNAIYLPGGVYLTPVDIAIIVPCVGVVGAIALALRYLKFGIAMRAAAEHPTLAAYLGVNVQTTGVVSWAIATVTATLAGIASAARGPVDFGVTSLGLYVFPALLIGGMDSLVGVLVGSFFLAIFQTAAATYLGGDWIDLAAYIALLAILVVKPTGFFGTPEYRRL
jgi:branched-chain amino acid transport system permease protein